MPARTFARQPTVFPHAKFSVTQITAIPERNAHQRTRAAALTACFEIFHARSFARQTPNMALPFASRNRTNVRFENKVGTKLESLTNFPREFTGGSEG